MIGFYISLFYHFKPSDQAQMLKLSTLIKHFKEQELGYLTLLQRIMVHGEMLHIIAFVLLVHLFRILNNKKLVMKTLPQT